MELANEKWIDGDESGLLGQFASNRGYSDLIKASAGYPALSNFFRVGVTDEVTRVREELGRLAERASADVASTARALLALSDGQELIIITDGES